MSHLTSNLIIKDLLKKLPEYLRPQWGQFVAQKQLRSPNIHQFAKWVSKTKLFLKWRSVEITKKKDIVEQITPVMFPGLFQTKTTNIVVFATLENTRDPNCEKFKRSDVKTRWRRLAELNRICFLCPACTRKMRRKETM
jgi:hypothetical protein